MIELCLCAFDSLLVRFGAVCRLVHGQWHSSAVVKEVNGYACVSTLVGGIESTIEVGEKIHAGVIMFSWSQDPRHFHAHIWFGVVSDHHGIN